MRSNKIFLPFVVLSLFVIGIISMSVADDQYHDKEDGKAKLTGTVDPAVSATVNVIDQSNDFDMERDRYGQEQQEHQEEFPGRADNIVATAEVDPETGEFEVTGLSAGTYTIEIEPHDERYTKKEIEDVELDEGEEKDLGEIDLEENDNGWLDDEEWE